MNPIDSTEYAMQLATFSSVEQQVLTNDLLRQMMGGQGAGLLDAARLIGQQVALAGPVPFQGAAVQMWAAPQPGASRAQLVVRDITGTEVARQSVAPDQGLLEWNGRTSTGQQAMAGSYLMTVEAWAGDVPLQPQPAQAYATVTELRDSALGVQVVTQTGAVAALSTVPAIRHGG
ncbi:MAG: FlgD immunoglobulin-like domain containing protein [Lutimaribacter sp.]